MNNQRAHPLPAAIFHVARASHAQVTPFVKLLPPTGSSRSPVQQTIVRTADSAVEVARQVTASLTAFGEPACGAESWR